MISEDPIARNGLASDWMHRGMDLLEKSDPESLREAVRCFDEALAIRLALHWKESHGLRYGLSAGWINRGDALTKLGSPSDLDEAIISYDKALQFLQTLPLGENPLYPRRFAIAWINRGVALQRRAGRGDEAETVSSFRAALDMLENSVAAAIQDRDLLQRGGWLNLGGALLQLPEAPAAEARLAAQKALASVVSLEKEDGDAAETGLRARHLVCRAIAHESRDGKVLTGELLAAATDAVDEALALARYWELRGENRFRDLAQEIFRFGCRIYQDHQPHFLAEFILESLDPEKREGVLPLNREVHEAAVAALWSVLKEIQRDGFQALSTTRFEGLMENLRELRVAEERLLQLRRAAR